ncbi:hypothetical protein B1813_00980 [Saccharomonospora piscinae]|uniref:Lipoprotein n=1 Tax=Saccharomonospora piscinae TaxID=687388 RepID=A0A1V9ACE3_SACPI|nr:hypothetical protein [Saccharomonospora piscinae]OQO94708.1 hypothetical protein B1813_00980 [Saccharomonospora piscinae]
MIRRAAGLGLVCLLLAACGGPGPAERSSTTTAESGSSMRTMTEDEAAQRAEEHIRRAVAALPEKPALTPLRADSAECLDPSDNGPRGRYEVGRSYWLDDLPGERNAEFVDALVEHWSAHDYRVLTDKRETKNRFVSVEHRGDAFRMSVKQSVEGDLSLGASSPCVWPDGTPPEDANE